MNVYRRAAIFHCPIRPTLSAAVVARIRDRIRHSPKKEYFDGEHVLKIAPQLYLMFFSPLFVRQTPHYHIGDPRHPDDLYTNGGGQRLLIGVTDTGIKVKTNHVTDTIPPHSFCSISFPGSPPTLHQFIGQAANNTVGTGLLSIHVGKHRTFPTEMMETHTLFRAW